MTKKKREYLEQIQSLSNDELLNVVLWTATEFGYHEHSFERFRAEESEKLLRERLVKSGFLKPKE